jgi:hypothetical protein
VRPSVPAKLGVAGESNIPLNVSTFADITSTSSREAEYTQVDYFPSGATPNSRFFESLGGGNPTDYKEFAWGIDDACPDWYTRYDRMYRRTELGGPVRGYRGTVRRVPRRLIGLRKTQSVNTFAETAPFSDPRPFWGFESVFQVGVDRLLIRTVVPPEVA